VALTGWFILPSYKIQIEENGKIAGYLKIEATDDAFWIDGIEVVQWFYDLVADNLWQAITTYYFDFVTETFIARPEAPTEPNKLTIIANGDDLFILTGLPIPCTVTVDNNTYEIDDGEFGFPTTISGIYKVKVESFPYITKEWEVIAE
jgi:hypothetical protein